MTASRSGAEGSLSRACTGFVMTDSLLRIDGWRPSLYCWSRLLLLVAFWWYRVLNATATPNLRKSRWHS